MTRRRLSVYLDTSVVFAAVLSPTGGARELFHLGEVGFLQLIVGLNVLREADEVVRRKAPGSLPLLARLLDAGQVETSGTPTKRQLETARALVEYLPDAYIPAEAMAAGVDWFVTHDKAHFLRESMSLELPFVVGTPGDLIQAIRNDFAGGER